MNAYEPLAGRGHHEHWMLRWREDFTLSPRQAVLMDAYRAAREAGHFYTVDVLRFVKDLLNVPPEVAAVGCDRVEGGDLGMDIYYARDAVEKAEDWVNRRAALAALQPVAGLKIGSLCINHKRTNAVTVESVEGDSVALVGKRGANTVTFSTTAQALINASVRAVEKGWRKTALAGAQ